MRKIVVFPNDPIYKYYEKGEIKPRYYNPGNLFDEVHLLTPCKKDIEPDKVQILAGTAKLFIHPLGKPGLLSLPRQLKRSARLVANIRPDLIRGHGMLIGGLLPVWAGQRNKIPVVVSIHGNYDKDVRGLVRKGVIKPTAATIKQLVWLLLFERYILSHTSRFISKYQSVVSYLKGHDIRDNKISLIYNWLDSKRFCPVEKKPGEKMKILTVNRQDDDKNPAELIRAMVDIDAELTLIGQGHLHESLRQLAADLGIDSRVRFIRSVPNSEIHKYYQAADIYAVCIQVTGISIGTLEAMACGLPIVYGRTPFEEKPEIAGDVALMVEPDSKGFLIAISQLIEDVEKRQQLGKRGRKRIESMETKTMEDRECDLYARVIAERQEKV